MSCSSTRRTAVLLGVLGVLQRLCCYGLLRVCVREWLVFCPRAQACLHSPQWTAVAMDVPFDVDASELRMPVDVDGQHPEEDAAEHKALAVDGQQAVSPALDEAEGTPATGSPPPPPDSSTPTPPALEANGEAHIEGETLSDGGRVDHAPLAEGEGPTTAPSVNDGEDAAGEDAAGDSSSQEHANEAADEAGHDEAGMVGMRVHVNWPACKCHARRRKLTDARWLAHTQRGTRAHTLPPARHKRRAAAVRSLQSCNPLLSHTAPASQPPAPRALIPCANRRRLVRGGDPGLLHRQVVGAQALHVRVRQPQRHMGRLVRRPPHTT
eukprot:4042491-Prymnesium_polylepis.2